MDIMEDNHGPFVTDYTDDDSHSSLPPLVIDTGNCNSAIPPGLPPSLTPCYAVPTPNLPPVLLPGAGYVAPPGEEMLVVAAKLVTEYLGNVMSHMEYFLTEYETRGEELPKWQNMWYSELLQLLTLYPRQV